MAVVAPLLPGLLDVIERGLVVWLPEGGSLEMVVVEEEESEEEVVEMEGLRKLLTAPPPRDTMGKEQEGWRSCCLTVTLVRRTS